MVDGFFKKVQDAVFGSQDEGYDPNAEYERDIRPASEDPYGDPADGYGQFADVRPASEDPYGDPADDYGQFADVRPASEDPYGDPADQGYA